MTNLTVKPLYFLQICLATLLLMSCITIGTAAAAGNKDKAQPVEITAPLPVPVQGSVNVANTPTVQVKNAAEQPLLVQNVSQGQVSPSEILPPTGRTIGGPGLFSRSGPGVFFILNSTLRSNGILMLPITACATVVATGDNPVFYSSTGDVGGFGSALAPGDSITFCNAKADRFTLECQSGPCSAVWRIDAVDVGKSGP